MKDTPLFGLERISDKVYFYGEITELDGALVVVVTDDNETCDECGHELDTYHYYESFWHLCQDWRIKEKLYI